MEFVSNHQLQFHHTGCLTDDIEASKEVYAGLFGFTSISATFTIESQQVKVCFIQTAPGVYIELVQPAEMNSFFAKIQKSKNPYYHIGYTSTAYDAALKTMIEKGCHMISEFHSEAFEGKRCSFLYTPEMHLVEIIEQNK